MTVSGLNPEFVKVWFNVVVGMPLSLYPVTCADEPVAVQVKVVPGMCEVQVTPVDWLLQICEEAGVFDKSGTG